MLSLHPTLLLDEGDELVDAWVLVLNIFFSILFSVRALTAL